MKIFGAISLLATLTGTVMGLFGSPWSSSEPEVTPEPPSLQQRAAEASHQIHVVDQELDGQMQLLRNQLKETLSHWTSAPEGSASLDAERLQLFKTFLNKALNLGDIVLANELEFRDIFTKWALTSGAAAQVYREAEASFRKAAEEAPYPETREFHETVAAWYAARAARVELRAQATIPTDVTSELERIRSLTEALRMLNSYVSEDPEFLKTSDEALHRNLQAFLQSFHTVSELLDQWTNQILDELEESGADEGSAAVGAST